MKPKTGTLRFIICSLGIHKGDWYYTLWGRIEARTCNHCHAISYRHARTRN